MSSNDAPLKSAYDVLLEYENRSMAHVAGVPETIDAPGLWRGIAFRVGNRRFVSNILDVVEILSIPSLTTVPGTQIWMMGIANVRGNLVPVADLRAFIESNHLRTSTNERSRVLLVKQGTNAVGLLIDEILGQRNFTDENRTLESSDDDPRYERFVLARYVLEGSEWGEFNTPALVRMPEFLQAAA